MLKRRKPYVPIFRSTAARMTEPTVGASVWASGSQVWKGNMGTLMAKASPKARNIQNCMWKGMARPYIFSEIKGVSAGGGAVVEVEDQNGHQHQQASRTW